MNKTHETNRDGVQTTPQVVLIVDDQVEQAELVCTILLRQGYEVYGAHTFYNAVQCVNSVKPDLAVIDIFLDDGRLGAELLVELRCFYPNLIVLFTSGIGEGKELDAALSYPRTAFIKKPYRIAAFAETVKQTLRKFSRD